MSDTLLKDKKCIPCSGEIPPLNDDEKQALIKQLSSGWKLVDEDKKLSLSVSCKDFATPMAIATEIAKLADSEWHHPDLSIGFGSLNILMWTHKIDNLVESDFIFASKVDEILKKYEEVNF